jgi:hypothetical protein
MDRRTKVPEQLVVFTGAFIFFLATLAANFSGPHDSIGYLNGIVSGKHLFHPHHLLYHFVTHYWFVFIKAILPGVKDYYLVEVFTALWGSGIMVITYNFFRNRFLLPILTSAIGITVIAFTYGPWFYSTNIEVYAPPMFFLLLALYIVSKNDFQRQDVWKVASLNILAILFHQVHVLFAVVILYKLWQERKRMNLVSAVAQYAIMGLVIVGAAYFIVGWVIEGNNSLAKWSSWFEGYAQEGAYWKPLNSKLPLLVATGYSHAFIGGHFVFRLPVVEKYLSESLSNHSLGDEMYLARHISHSLAVFLTVLSAILGILMLWLTIRFARHYKTILKTAGHVVTPLMIAGIVYSIFFCFWMPEILEFWIFQTILVWLLLLGTFNYAGQGLPAFKGWGPVKPFILMATISILLFVINFFGSVRWILDIENDLYYVKIKQVKEVVRDKDMVLLQDAWQLKDFLTYFTKAKALEAPAADSLRPAIDKAVNDCLSNGGKVYIYTEATHYQAQGTVYIDSLLKVYEPRKKVFPDSSAIIMVVE